MTRSTGRTYYVNAAGLDTNSGLSAAAAWLTIARVNAQQYNPGDFVLFAGGQSFAGSLFFGANNRGNAENPITVKSYGGGVATINSAALVGCEIYDTAGIEVRNLTFVGTGTGLNAPHGIYVHNDSVSWYQFATILDHIVLDTLNVSGYGGNGIFISGEAGLSGFSNVTINNCTVSGCTFSRIDALQPDSAGIIVSSQNQAYGQGQFNYAPFQTITISNCTSYNNVGVTANPAVTGNGIYMGQTYGGLITNCVAHDNGAADAGGCVGIWAYDCNFVTIQFCEVYNQTTTSANDGDGYDIDSGAFNSTLQYNYSHNNYGAGYLIYSYNDGFVFNSQNITVRYNISENDCIHSGTGNTGSIYIYNGAGAGGLTGVSVYGNTVYQSRAGYFALRLNQDFTGFAANNIFYSTGTAGLLAAAAGVAADFPLRGNDWYSAGTFSMGWAGIQYGTYALWQTASAQEKVSGSNVGLTANPLLTNPGGGGTIGGYIPANLTAYLVQAGTPCKGGGQNLATLFGVNLATTQDYYRNPALVGVSYDIGADAT